MNCRGIMVVGTAMFAAIFLIAMLATHALGRAELALYFLIAFLSTGAAGIAAYFVCEGSE